MVIPGIRFSRRCGAGRRARSRPRTAATEFDEKETLYVDAHLLRVVKWKSAPEVFDRVPTYYSIGTWIPGDSKSHRKYLVA